MKSILIVGGANGIGLSIAKVLSARVETEKIYIVDKVPLSTEYKDSKIESFQFDLNSFDYSIFDQFSDIDGLMITAGFGKLELFEHILRVIKHFYEKLLSQDDFYCGVMVSIAGFMSSPFFSIYGATKAALKIFIESVNVELEKAGSPNRILNVSPGSIKGTCFNQGQTDLSVTEPLTREIIKNLETKNDLFIPNYDMIYKNVLERYHADFRAEGRHSYDYKLRSGRVKIAPPPVK